jgi:hypothetical protein
VSVQTANSLDVAVASATASTIQATGLGAFTGFHLAIASSTAGAEGQIRYAFTSAGRTDVLKVTPPWDTVPAVNDDLIVAKNQDNYNTDYGNKWKLVLKAAAEWVAGDFFDVGDGTDAMIFGIIDQAVSLDDYFRVYAGSFMQVGYLFGETSLGGWYFNNSDQNATLGYQMLRVDSSATFVMANANLGTVDAHAAIFKTGSEPYFYDASFTNLMYDGFRLKGNARGFNLKLQGAGVANDYCVVASTLASFDGPITLSGSYGFQSSALAETIKVNKYISVNNSQDVEAHNSTTWEFHNPNWGNPQILWTQSTGQSTVSEIFTLVGKTAQTDGTAIASSLFVMTEGSATVRSNSNTATADASGVFTDDVLSRHWASSTASTTFGPFVGRAWKYAFTPFEGAQTFDDVTELNMALGTDGEVTETAAASALALAAVFTDETSTFDGVWYVKVSVTATALVSAVVSAPGGYAGTIREVHIAGDGLTQEWFLVNTSSTTGTPASTVVTWSEAGTARGDNVASNDHVFTYHIDAKNAALADAYDKQQAEFADTSTTEAWVSTARLRSTRLMNKTGANFDTEAYFSTGVFISNRGAGTVDQMTADDGFTFTPPEQFTFTLTGLKGDSEVRVYNAADDSLLAGDESVGDQLIDDFDIDNAGAWALSANWSIAGGLLTAGGVTLTNATPDITPAVVSGRQYRVSYKVSNYAAGAHRVIIGGITTAGGTSDGVFTEDIVTINTTGPAITGIGALSCDIEWFTVHDLSAATFSYNYTYSGSDITAYVIIFHLDWKEIRLSDGSAITLSNTDQSIPIQQNIDRVFRNP